MAKKQWLSDTQGSVALAVAYAVIKVYEDNLDDPDPNRVGYELHGRDPLERPPEPGETIEATIYGAPGIDEEVALEGDRLVLVRGVEGPGGERLTRLYDRAMRAVLRHDRAMIRKLAADTTATGVEYMLIYLRDGRLVGLEGEVDRVRIPHVNIAAGSIHTHPHGACGLSAPDVRSGLDLLVDGGIFEVAATETCAFVMLRKGLILEEDYLEILGWNDSIWRPKKLKSIEFIQIPL